MIRAPLVVVVGICASGKTTLVDGLRKAGFSALEVGQEHSGLPYLWARSDPAYLVYLEADDELVYARRKYLTPDRLERERRLLAYARQKADLHVDATGKSPAEVLDEVVAALEKAGVERVLWEPDRPFENWGRDN